MNLLSDSSPGPSRPPRPSSPHRRESSWEFGDFSTAPSTQPSTSTLDHGDLLGSFEDLNQARRPAPSAHAEGSATGPTADLMDDEGWTEFFNQQQHSKPPEAVKPIVIDLPPRPTEMPADYVPPARPRRMSQQRLSFSGPSSPPLVSHVGADITYRPTPESQRQPSYTANNGQIKTEPRHGSPLSRSPTQSKLMHTLATTTKIASKWKTVLDPSMFHPPSNHQSGRLSAMPGLNDNDVPARFTAEPIEVTHTTPFATPEQVAGSYTAPGGAPAFNAHEKQSQKRGDAASEWPETKLIGRRLGTSEILTPHLADSLRQALPPRQRLSSTWSLLCKLTSSHLKSAAARTYQLQSRLISMVRLCQRCIVWWRNTRICIGAPGISWWSEMERTGCLAYISTRTYSGKRAHTTVVENRGPALCSGLRIMLSY